MTLIPPIQTRSLAFYRRPVPIFDRWASGIALPPTLAGLHLDRPLRDWISGLARSVFEDLERGIEIQDSRAGRRIFLLKTFDMYIRADLRHIRSISYWPNGERRDITLAIGSMFGVDRWMSEWLLHRAVSLAALHSSMEAHALAYPTGYATRGLWLAEALGGIWTWASEAMIRLLKRTLNVPLMRHAMRDAIGADRALLNLARPARYGFGGTHDVTCDWYNLCVRHRYQLERVSQKAPGLLPYLGALMRTERIEPEQPPFAVMRQNLLVSGATGADWRFLMRSHARPVWKYVRETRMTAKIDRLLCSWAACHRGLDQSQLVPERMWLDLMRTAVSNGSVRFLPGNEVRVPPGLMRSAMDAASKAAGRGEMTRFRNEEWLPVVRWLAYRCKNTAVAKLRSWSRAVHRARIDDRMQAASAQANDRHWPYAIDRFEQGGLVASALASPSRLVEEAIAMRHCADNNLEACDKGTARLFSIRRGHGQRVATLALSQTDEGTWAIEDLKGFANAPCPEQVRDLAVALRDAYGGLEPMVVLEPTYRRKPCLTMKIAAADRDAEQRRRLVGQQR